MTSQPPGDTPASPAQRIAWSILILLTLYACYFSHLDVIGFVGPDEPRYAWIARDMAESGDWITPRLYGRPWFEKPPLLYWGGAIFFKLFGEGHPEIAARLPSAISALLATLALAWLAWRTYGEECARWLLLLLPTSVGMIAFSHAAATDMPFAGMLTIALVCGAVALGLAAGPQSADEVQIVPHTPWLALLLFGFFLGLAALAKGPAAIILIAGAVFFWALFTKRWRDAFRLLHPAALAAFCLTTLPWYILCARRNPDFFRIFIIEHNFKRYLTPEFQHLQPFWFYFPVLLIAFLPWTTAFLAAIVLGLQQFSRGRHFGRAALFLLSWSIICVVFFSVSKSKLPGYVLPAVPAIALLAARAFVLGRSGQPGIFRYSAIVGVVLLALGSGSMSVVAGLTAHTSYSTSSLATSLCVILLLFAVANGILWAAFTTTRPSASSPRIFVAIGLVAPILVTMLSLGSLSHFLRFWDPSARVVAEELLMRGTPTNQLTVHHMNRSLQYGLSFYLKNEMLDWDSARPTKGYLLTGRKDCGQIVSGTAECEQAPIYLERSQRFLYRFTPANSLPRSDSSRQPQ